MRFLLALGNDAKNDAAASTAHFEVLPQENHQTTTHMSCVHFKTENIPEKQTYNGAVYSTK